jgi:hypothetical protein
MKHPSVQGISFFAVGASFVQLAYYCHPEAGLIPVRLV